MDHDISQSDNDFIPGSEACSSGSSLSEGSLCDSVFDTYNSSISRLALDADTEPMKPTQNIEKRIQIVDFAILALSELRDLLHEGDINV